MARSTSTNVFRLSIVAVVMLSGTLAALVTSPRPFNRHATETLLPHEKGEQEAGGPAQEQYDDRAFPATDVSPSQQAAAQSAFDVVAGREFGIRRGWDELGPFTPNAAAETTYTGRATTTSGRVTALALSPRCVDDDCVLFAAAAGGGVWKTSNALASKPRWASSNRGIQSTAIGSIVFDPTDARGKTLYAGTGEANGSGDSEAGVGLFKSVDGGKSWSLVPGSPAAASGRSVAAIAVDPMNRNHLFIGTAVARHGSSAVNGGRFTPPSTPPVGLYESTDGGASFRLAFSLASDVVSPGSPNGSDFFRGGVSKIATDRTGLGAAAATRVYFSIFDYGLYRSKQGGGFEQVFASAGGGQDANSPGARTEFALSPMGTKLRIYLGDSDGGEADFYRTDDANVAVPIWGKLSASAEGTPGFGSFNFCGEQCSYDMVVASPPGRPDVVWLGGQMQYDEIFTAHPPSNGRAVLRSTDAGLHFTDMTNDARTPPLGMHPDQHDIVFVPAAPDVAFLASDGGVVRTSGQFADASADCVGRGLSALKLADCLMWLKTIPTKITSLNDGLRTLQFHSLSIGGRGGRTDVMGGTQDNGTWVFSAREDDEDGEWVESVGGDGGQSGIDRANADIRMHTYTFELGDVNFRGGDPLGWNFISDPLSASKEAASFYAPLINDPKVSNTWFFGLQHVWRTKDNAGPRAYLELHCNEFFGDTLAPCGDWEPLGGPAGAGKPGDLVGPSYGSTKGGSFVVATVRAPSDASTLWAATRRGRLFVSKNADAASAAVTFTRIDTAAQPQRFISGIAVDPRSPNHAYVSFSGYAAYTPTTLGHVFEVTYNPASGTSAWTDLSFDLGDQPITGIAFDAGSGDLFAATDFGVLMLARASSTWRPAAPSLPLVAVYGLTLDGRAGVLYAATHGRGAWRLKLRDWD